MLGARGAAVEEIEITEKTPSRTELMNALREHGTRSVFNTSGVRYRELGLKDKIETMSNTEAAKLLASDGKLIKRPFLVVDEKKTILGFKDTEWKKL